MTKIYAVYRHGRLRMETLFAAPMDARYVVYFQCPESDVAIPVQVCDDVPMEQVRAAALDAYRRDHFMGVKSDLERLFTHVLETYPGQSWSYILVGHNRKVVDWFFRGRQMDNLIALNLNPDALATQPSLARMGSLHREIATFRRRKVLIVDYSYATTGVAAVAQWIRARFPGFRVKTVAIAEIERIPFWDRDVTNPAGRFAYHRAAVSGVGGACQQLRPPARLQCMAHHDMEVPV